MVNVLQKTAFLTDLLTAWLVLAVIFAGIFIIVENRHDHTGADCRICLEIQIAQRLIEAFARLGMSTSLAGLIRSAMPVIKPQTFVLAIKPSALKVKLNC